MAAYAQVGKPRNGANNAIPGERSVNPIDVYKEDLAWHGTLQKLNVV